MFKSVFKVMFGGLLKIILLVKTCRGIKRKKKNLYLFLFFKKSLLNFMHGLNIWDVLVV